MKLAIQQFQLRKCFLDNETAFSALQKVRRAGFSGIELNAFMTERIPFFARALCALSGMSVGKSGTLDWRELCRYSDLEVVSLHSDLDTIMTKPDKVIAEAKKYKTPYVVITGVYNYDFSSPEKIKSLSARLNRAGEVLKESNLALLYHNHNCEFIGGLEKKPYEMLVDLTDPHLVNFELDCYWAVDAGASAERIINSLLKNRLKLLHVSDKCAAKKGFTPIRKTECTEIGSGNIDYAPILNAAKNCGAEYVVLESTNDWVNSDALRSMQVSAEHLRNLVL